MGKGIRRRAADNGRKINKLLTDRDGAAYLYRTVTAGPSGQLSDLRVGFVEAITDNPEDEWPEEHPDGYDLVIREAAGGKVAGYARRDPVNGWSILDVHYNGSAEWFGYADTLSAGVDALINGMHAATGRHDSRRISPGKVRTAGEVHEAAERRAASGEFQGRYGDR